MSRRVLLPVDRLQAPTEYDQHCGETTDRDCRPWTDSQGACGDRQDSRDRASRRPLIPVQKPACQFGPTRPSGSDGLSLQISLNIFGKLAHRTVALRRPFAQRLENDVIQVTLEASAQVLWRRLPSMAHVRRKDGADLSGAGGLLSGPRNRTARPYRTL